MNATPGLSPMAKKLCQTATKTGDLMPTFAAHTDLAIRVARHADAASSSAPGIGLKAGLSI